MEQRPKSRILMVNFEPGELSPLTAAGYTADLGFVGERLRYHTPYPFYDYDVYVYNSTPLSSPERYFSDAKDLPHDQHAVQALTRLGGAPYIRIVFAGGAPAIVATLAGVPGVEFYSANENVSRFIVAEQPVFGIPEVHEAIAALRSRILTPIGHYVRRSKEDQWPFQHFPVVVNRKGDQIAAYAVNASAERSLLLYIVVPQLDNNASGLVKILDAIRKWNPAVLPEFGEQAWYDSEEFVLPEERAIQKQITAKLAEAKEFVEARRQEQTRARNRLGFIKRILVATEDPQLLPEDHLSTNIKRTLEFLGFSVEDIDAKIKGAIRKEDFWVTDGDFLAITEVTGTTNKNPSRRNTMTFWDG